MPLDIIRRSHAHHTRPLYKPSLQPRPAIQPQPKPQPTRFTPPASPSRIKHRRRFRLARLQLPAIIAAAMLSGVLAQSAAFGQLGIAIYGVTAIIWRIPSHTTFTLALLSMGTSVLIIFRGNGPLAENFATYTFLFLVVGVITLIREVKKEGGRVYSNRKNIS